LPYNVSQKVIVNCGIVNFHILAIPLLVLVELRHGELNQSPGSVFNSPNLIDDVFVEERTDVLAEYVLGVADDHDAGLVAVHAKSVFKRQLSLTRNPHDLGVQQSLGKGLLGFQQLLDLLIAPLGLAVFDHGQESDGADE